MEQQKTTQIVEALLFAAETPLSIRQLRNLLSEFDPEQVGAAVAELRKQYNEQEPARGIELVQVAGGWRFRTRADLSPWVRRLYQQTPLRIGRAMLEVLAIVAYRQPVTRAEVDAIRGVDSAGSLRALLERELIRVVGRKELPGRPQLYGTTKTFLEVFGLR
ncbi:MAG: SMC-Scp complex subunit ScpB, partial [Candidatus Dadabacteria bacterium]